MSAECSNGVFIIHHDLISTSDCFFCLASEKLNVRCHNTLYQAVRRWWLLSPYSPLNLPTTCHEDESTVARRLLTLLHFSNMTTDFLLDVVKPDAVFVAKSSVGCELCQSLRADLNKWLFAAFEAHAYKRAADSNSDQQKLPFAFIDFTLRDVSKMADGVFIFSPTQFVDGYGFRFQAGKKKWHADDSYRFALFLSVDRAATGLVNLNIL